MPMSITSDNSPACLMLAPLSPTPASTAPSGGEDGVDLVQEDGGGGVVTGHLEQGTHLYTSGHIISKIKLYI